MSGFPKQLIAQSLPQGLEEFIQEFLLGFLSPQTQKAYAQDLKEFFNFIIKSQFSLQEMAELSSTHFALYRNSLKDKGLAAATIHRKLVSVRSFVKWLMAKNILDHNPLEAIKLPKISDFHETQAFTDEETQQMLEAPDLTTFEGSYHRLLLVFLFYLGLRRSEVVKVRLQDIFQERHHQVLKLTSKGGKKRLLPLSDPVLQEITFFQERFFALTGKQLKVSDYFFRSQKGLTSNKPINQASVYKIVAKYAKVLHINKKLGAHSCRATAISHLLDTQKVPLRDVADFAGHTKITTTERYDKRRQQLDNHATYKVKFLKKA